MVKNRKFDVSKHVLHHSIVDFTIQTLFWKPTNFTHIPLIKFVEYAFSTLLAHSIRIVWSQNHLKQLQGYQISSRKKMLHFKRIFSHFSPFLVIFRDFGKIHYSDIFICGSTQNILRSQKFLPSKNMKSQLSNAPSTAFIAYLVPKKSSFQYPKHPQQ